MQRPDLGEIQEFRGALSSQSREAKESGAQDESGEGSRASGAEALS